MNPLLQAANGMLFFTGFVPSFSAAGHRLRALTHEPLAADFRGQRWLISGASTGLGRALALAAAAAGAEVLAVARSTAALQSLADAAGTLPGRVAVRSADLSTIAAVDDLANAVLAEGPPPNVLVNNVGVLFDRPAMTSEGLDRGFATNLLGPWHLTERLRAAGALGAGACVITMSSGGLYNVRLSVRALERQTNYDGTLAYAFHKRAQLAVNHAWRRDARGAEYYVMHPGWARTPGVETSLPTFNRLLGPLLRTPEEGIDTALWLAARRPQQQRPEGLWFDRRLRPEHLLFGSRGGAAEEDVIAALQAAVTRARSTTASP